MYIGDMMKMWLPHYIGELYKDVPSDVYEGLASIICAIAVFAFFIKGVKRGCNIVFSALIVEYIVLIYGATVLFRPYSEESGYNFTPFWSYYEIQGGRGDLLAENIMNVVVFAPLGLFLACISRTIKWWHVLLIGLGLSVSIEISQLIFKKGFSEFDDVFHNTLGCMLGYGVFCMFAWFIRKIRPLGYSE